MMMSSIMDDFTASDAFENAKHKPEEILKKFLNDCTQDLM